MAKVDDPASEGTNRTALAREALEAALSAQEALWFARWGSADYSEEAPASVHVAHAEGVERVEALAQCAYTRGVGCLMVEECLAEAEHRAARTFARHAWYRAAYLSPYLCLDRQGGPPEVPPLTEDGTTDATWRLFCAEHETLHAVASPGTFWTEYAEHVARAAGCRLPATEAVAVRAARGASSHLATLAWLASINLPSMSAPPKVWDHLLRVGTRRDGLSAHLVFLEAVRGARVAAERELEWFKTMPVPSLGSVFAEYLAGVDEFDGPRDLARKALRALGHDPKEFNRAEKLKKLRAEDKARPNRARAPGGRPPKTPVAKAK